MLTNYLIKLLHLEALKSGLNTVQEEVTDTFLFNMRQNKHRQIKKNYAYYAQRDDSVC